MKKLKSFYEEYIDIFEDYLQNARKNLKKSNEKYNKLNKEYHEILRKNRNLNWILEGEVKGRELFFLGAKENYCYLKNIRVLE